MFPNSSVAIAGFADPDVYRYLEAEGYSYAIRLKGNQVLQDNNELIDSKVMG